MLVVLSGFADVVTALLLFLTLPVTVATAKRPFSIQAESNQELYLRNSMGQTRFRGLSLLAIGASRAKSMDINELITQLADMNSRRIRLD